MADGVVLDTDVASQSIRGRLPTWLAKGLAGRTMFVTFVTVGELMKWAEVYHWGIRKRTVLVEWLGRTVILPYDPRVAYQWGSLSGAAQERGRPRPQNDTWVAACCLVEDLPLATLNVKDYEDFVEHHGLRLVQDDEVS
ncbi:MAG: type II toxin-antitoxin system VapC family toxin [Nocardioidaceae bacterium]